MANGPVGAGECPDSDDQNLHQWFSDSDDPEAAIPILTDFVRAHPSRPDALLALALAFVRVGKVDSAKQAVRRARFLAPEIAGLLGNDAPPDAGALQAALDLLLRAPSATAAPSQPDPFEVSEVHLRAAASPPAPESVPVEADVEHAIGVPAPFAILRADETLPATPPDNAIREVAVGLSPVFDLNSRTAPLGPVGLPDGWMLARLSLELWVRRFVVWALPPTVCNLFAALAMPWVSESSLSQALLWVGSVAVGGAFSLRAIARQWSPEAVAEGVPPLRRSGVLLAPLFVFLLVASPASILAARAPLRGDELLALGMLVSLPLLALLAPAVMLWVTRRGGLQEGLHLVKRSLSRRMWTYLAVVVLGGSLGGGLLLTLGWGFLSTLGVIDPLWIRLLQAVGIGLAESFVLVMIATCGLDALESQLRPALMQEEFAAG